MIGTLRTVVLDAAEAGRLAAFSPPSAGGPSCTPLADPAGHPFDLCQPVLFQQNGEYHAPRWPDPVYPQQVHLDVTVEDVDAAEAEVLELGAISLSSGGVNWRVYADPAGKPSCLCWD